MAVKPAGPAPTDPQIAAILADITAGLTLRAACAGASVDIEPFLRGLAIGASAKSGRWRDIRGQVVAAQVEARRAAQSILTTQASRGAPAALGALIARLAKPDELLDPTPTDPRAFAAYRLADVRRRMETADGIAFTQLIRQENALLESIKALDEAARLGIGGGPNRTPAEVFADETAHAGELAELHLQLYVVEYLRRHPGIYLSTASGRIEIMAS